MHSVSTEPPRFNDRRCLGQVWILSNGAGFFVLATYYYMSAKVPEPVEVSQAHDIVCRITLVEPS